MYVCDVFVVLWPNDGEKYPDNDVGYGDSAVADPDPPRSRSQKTNKKRYLGRNISSRMHHMRLRFQHFLGNPSRAYKRLAVPAVVCILYILVKNRRAPRLSIPGSATAVLAGSGENRKLVE